MGAGYSSLLKETELEPGLGDIPENCVARILGYLDPPEICNLGRLNRAFRQASWADSVWEPKLPGNYECLVKKLFRENPEDLCKRDVFERLCSPNRFDGGTKVTLSLSLSDKIVNSVSASRFWFVVWYIPIPVFIDVPFFIYCR